MNSSLSVRLFEEYLCTLSSIKFVSEFDITIKQSRQHDDSKRAIVSRGLIFQSEL